MATPTTSDFLVVPINGTDLIAFYRGSNISRPLYLSYSNFLAILTQAISGGTNILLQTNNVDNPAQNVLNLIEGTGIDITATAGGVTISANSGTSFITAITNSSDINLSVVSSTLSATLTNTAVTPNTYGTGTQVPQITVDSKGRITGVTNVPITVAGTGTVTVVGVNNGAGINATISGNPNINPTINITNTAPDQTVAITGGATIDISGGGYPNFTIRTNVSTNQRLLGRFTAGAGAYEEITIGTGINLSAAGVLTGTGTGTGTVTSITAGTGLVASTDPNPITVAGTIQLNTKLAPADNLAGNAGKFLRVNAGATAVEYATVTGTGTVQSVALSMPAAFTVTGSPITTLGTLAVTATGASTQYIAGDGTLVTFPTIPTVTPAALTKADDTNVTLTLGGTPATALLQAASITAGWTGTLATTRGGTGLSSIGAGLQYLRVNSGATGLEYATFPTIPTVAPAALTKTDDTNVTLTLGGTPSTALLQATSITAGWTGTLAIARGGTGLSSLGTSLQFLRVNSGGTALEYATVSVGSGITELTTDVTTPAASSGVTVATLATPLKTGSFGVTVDGVTAIVQVGKVGYVTMPYGGTITGWSITANAAGNIQFDIWRANGAIPTTTIVTDGTYPALLADDFDTQTAVSGWDRVFIEGAVFGFQVIGTPTVIKNATLTIRCTKSPV